MCPQTLTLPAEIEAAAALIPDAHPDVRGSRDEIAAIAAIIAERFRPERIVLFGSRAYGAPTYDSDVDLMVVMDTPLRTHEQATLIRQSLPEARGFSLDILVRTPERIALGLAERDFFIEDVMLKGITLYENGPLERGEAKMTTNGDHGGRAAEAEPNVKVATREWLAKGESDLRGAQFLRTAPTPEFDLICFHAQQSAEKYLKALLQECEVPSPRTHQLDELAQIAVQAVPGIAFNAADLKWRSDYAVDVRYPGVRAGETESKRAIQIAEDVRAVVRGALGLSTGSEETGA